MSVLHNWHDIPAEAVGSTSRRRIPGIGATLVRVEVAAGVAAGRHSHDHEQFVQVIAGRGTLETSDGHQRFAAGSVFHLPAGTWHAARFDEDTVLVETNLAGKTNVSG